MPILGDFHTHTLFSHGKGTIEDNVNAALAKGLKAIAITDHGFRHSMYNVRRSDFPFQRREIERLRALHPEIQILLGLETNLQGNDGVIDVKESDIDDLDIIVCGYHKLVFAPDLKNAFGFWLPTLLDSLFGKSSAKRRAKNTDAFIAAIHRYPVDVISHPKNDIDIDVAALARECAALGVYFELNGKRIQMTDAEIAAAADTGVKFLIDSDAHSPERVGEVLLPSRVAARVGLSKDQIANWNKLPVFRSQEEKRKRLAAQSDPNEIVINADKPSRI